MIKALLSLMLPWGSLLILSACQPDIPETIQQGMVYCAEGSPESFNPQRVTSGTTIDAISQQLYDRLLDIDPATGELLPALATKWRLSEDGKTYWFTLRPDVQSSPHRVFFSWQNPKCPGREHLPLTGFCKPNIRTIRSVEQTIRIFRVSAGVL